MTILVGLLCEDGIVVGADEVASTPSIEQPFKKKIEIIDDHVILAYTGAVGHAQRFHAVVKKMWSEKKFQSDVTEVGTRISELSQIDFRRTMSPLQLNQGWGFGALVAFPCNTKQHCLIEYDPRHFNPEQKTNEFNFVSMGCGQPIADPFLGFLRKIFIKENTLPKLNLGRLIVHWTLLHTIELNTGGIGGEPHIAILDHVDRGQTQARMLSKDELQEQNQHLIELEEYISEYSIGKGTNVPPADLPEPCS